MMKQFGPILTIARRELMEAIRSRWVVLSGALFGVLALALSVFGMRSVGAVGFGGFSRTAIGLLNLALYLVPLLGSKRLESLAVADVRRFLVRLEKETTAATAKESHRVLRSALSSACREELITRNVAKLVEPPRTDSRELKPWSLNETLDFLAAARRTRSTQPSCSPSPWARAGGRSSVSAGVRPRP